MSKWDLDIENLDWYEGGSGYLDLTWGNSSIIFVFNFGNIFYLRINRGFFPD